MKLLLISALALGLLCPMASADLQTLARLDLSAQPAETPLTAVSYSGSPLPLPSSVSIGEGNRIVLTDSGLLLHKAAGAGRASFGFSWPGGTLPPTGVFSVSATLQIGRLAQESGNFTIGILAPDQRLFTLQLNRAGALLLIASNGTEPTPAGTLSSKGLQTLEFILDYDQKEVRLLVNGTLMVSPLPFDGGNAPSSVAFASSTVKESEREILFRDITITHALGEP